MKIQTRLTLLCTLSFVVIFLIIALITYISYYNYTKKYIYDNLVKTSYITALFYLEEDELNKEEFALVKKQYNEFVTNSFYQIYNEDDEVSYGSNLLTTPPELLTEIRRKHKLSFTDKDFFCHGIFYEDNEGDFVVIAREKKDVLFEQLNILLTILVLVFLLGIIATIFISKWVANIAYKPFRKIIDQVNRISTNDLDVQIEYPDTKDEMQDLISTFNKLLSKISETVIIQKNFINYVSHEFKTPLASILGNLEVFSLKERSSEEYEQLSNKLIQEITQLEEMLNGLMVVSDLRKEAETAIQLRIDELIWQIIGKITERYNYAKILVYIEIKAEDEVLLFVNKDRTQLIMALYNLMENAVKYSKGESVEIIISKIDRCLSIGIIDKGIGIPQEKLDEITKPFFRGANTSLVEGTGIGLSIALRILEKNNIDYTITSQVNKGTQVWLSFKR